MWMCQNIFYFRPCSTMPDMEIIEFIISEIDLYLINKVRELRVPQELSQVKLSILMGLAEGAVGKIENPKERAKYNIRHLNLLAKALKCSPKDLMPEKPLKNDMVRVKMKIRKNGRHSPGEPNFEIIKVDPIDD
jgi:transcriptional regulator with XRE-family HTH domain